VAVDEPVLSEHTLIPFGKVVCSRWTNYNY